MNTYLVRVYFTRRTKPELYNVQANSTREAELMIWDKLESQQRDKNIVDMDTSQLVEECQE